MLANFKHGLAPEEEDGGRKINRKTNKRINNSDYAESVHHTSIMRINGALKIPETIKCKVLTEDKCTSDKLVLDYKYCRNGRGKPFSSESQRYIVDRSANRHNTDTIHYSQQALDNIRSSNVFQEKDLKNNPEMRMYILENPSLVERNENVLSKDSSIIQNNETVSNSEESKLEPENSAESESFFKDPSIPKYFRNYIEGLQVSVDSKCPLDSKPSWVDVDKYRTGQKVALKYLFGLQFSQLLSLLLVLNGPNAVEPLIFTGKSDTPFKAFKRYLSTALRVRSWYLDDIWNPQTEGHKHLKTVRAMHENLRKNLEAAGPEERRKRSTLTGKCDSGCPAIWSTLQDDLREDFEGTCPYPKISESEFKKMFNPRVHFNQTEMCMTQFGFVGLFIKYPSYFGAHRITEKELDSFVHLWRSIGYLLGVEDKYNFCNGDLETVRQKTTDLIEHIYKPSLRRISQEWEHMTRCVNVGISHYVPGVTFEVSLQYLCDMLELQTPRLWSSLTFRQKIVYYLTYFTFWIVMRIPGSEYYHSMVVNRAMKRGETAPPELLKKWEERKYSYQENAACT